MMVLTDSNLKNNATLEWNDALHMLAQIATTVGYGSNVDAMAKETPDYNLKFFHGAHGFAGLLVGVGSMMNAVADLTLKVMERPMTLSFKKKDPDYLTIHEDCKSEMCIARKRAILKGRMFKRGVTLINVFLLCSIWLFVDFQSKSMKDSDSIEILGRTWYVLIITMTSVGYGDFAPGTKFGTATAPLMLPLLLESYAKFQSSVFDLNYADIMQPMQVATYDAATKTLEDPLNFGKDFKEMVTNTFLLSNCPLYDKTFEHAALEPEPKSSRLKTEKDDSHDPLESIDLNEHVDAQENEEQLAVKTAQVKLNVKDAEKTKINVNTEPKGQEKPVDLKDIQLTEHDQNQKEAKSSSDEADLKDDTDLSAQVGQMRQMVNKGIVGLNKGIVDAKVKGKQALTQAEINVNNLIGDREIKK